MKKKNLSKNLWHRATKVIPGGNGLLSNDPKDIYPKIGQLIIHHVKEWKSRT